jgi:hypothetical protein
MLEEYLLPECHSEMTAAEECRELEGEVALGRVMALPNADVRGGVHCQCGGSAELHLFSLPRPRGVATEALHLEMLAYALSLC